MSELSIDDQGVRKVQPDEWITRTVWVTDPFAAEIEVKINLTQALKQSAFYALVKEGGESLGHVSKSTLTREGMSVRDVWLRLNGKDRHCFLQNPSYTIGNSDRVAPEFEILPEENR